MTGVEDTAAELGLGNAAEPPAPERGRIDLDAARKARREKRGPAPFVIFFGDRYELPHALPAEVIDFVDEVQRGDFTAVTKAFRLLLGGDTYDAIVKRAKEEGDPLELEDTVFLLESALEIYEVTLPESKGSVRPS